MKDAMISDTVVYGLSQLLNASNKMLSAVGMLFLQNVINFFITGSSSQATITMPIMTPVGGYCGREPPDRRAGLLLRRWILRYVLAHRLYAELRPDGGASGQVVPVYGPLFLIMMALQTFFIALSVFVYP